MLENYAKWNFLLAVMPFMSDEFAELAFTFSSLLQPGTLHDITRASNEPPHIIADIRMPPRYVRCVNFVEGQVPLLVARAFTDVYLPPEIRVRRL